MSLITYTSCPCCHGTHIQECLRAEDFTVSHEVFGIWECSDCSFRFTQAVPDAADSAPYYKASAYISHTDTREGFINRAYHLVRKLTLQQKRRLVEKTTGTSKGRMLDIGAGTGAFAYVMQQVGWQVTALEPDPDARRQAKSRYQLDLLPAGAISQLPDSGYDAITLWHVLEHVHELHPYLDRIRQLLRPSGRLFIAVPNYSSYDARVYGKFWAAYDVPRHLYHFSPASMRHLLGLHGLKLAASRPMWFDSYYISLLSEGYRSGVSRPLKAGWIGLQSNLRAMGDREKCSSLVYIAENLSV